MKAIKLYYAKKFQWLFVMMNNFETFSESEYDVLSEIDGVLHVSDFSESCLASEKKPKISKTVPFGCDTDIFHANGEAKADDTFRIVVSGKNRQSDNLPMVMQAVHDIWKDGIKNIKLYLHANVYEKGDHDLAQFAQKLDPQQDLIDLPEKFISLFEGLSDQEYADILRKSHLFISVPMTSSSSCSVYEAISCGCVPLVLQGTAHGEAVKRCSQDSSCQLDPMLTRALPLMNAGHGYLQICDQDDLKRRILYFYEIFQGGKGHLQSNLVCSYTQKKFLQEFSDLLDNINQANSGDQTLNLTSCG